MTYNVTVTQESQITRPPRNVV